MSGAGLSFTADPADVDESCLPGELPGRYAQRLALAKAVCTAARHAEGVVLGADTIVVVDGEILGKPSSPDDARYMIGRISGREHEVITAVALVDIETGRQVAGIESTMVRIRALSEAEMDAYVKTGEPLDKAGGYGIQGRAAFFVTGITGCYFNVVGLPLARLGAMAEGLGRPLPYLELG